jgi:hypothetical protein
MSVPSSPGVFHKVKSTEITKLLIYYENLITGYCIFPLTKPAIKIAVLHQ